MVRAMKRALFSLSLMVAACGGSGTNKPDAGPHPEVVQRQQRVRRRKTIRRVNERLEKWRSQAAVAIHDWPSMFECL